MTPPSQWKLLLISSKHGSPTGKSIATGYPFFRFTFSAKLTQCVACCFDRLFSVFIIFYVKQGTWAQLSSCIQTIQVTVCCYYSIPPKRTCPISPASDPDRSSSLVSLRFNKRFSKYNFLQFFYFSGFPERTSEPCRTVQSNLIIDVFVFWLTGISFNPKDHNFLPMRWWSFWGALEKAP